jgi:3-methyladenine DNA glycosylase Tag
MEAFPSWRYGPGGQAAVFKNADAVPPGWHDHPSKVVEPNAEPEPAAEDAPALPTRKQITEALKARGATFKGNAPTSALMEQLAALEAADEPTGTDEEDSDGA